MSEEATEGNGYNDGDDARLGTVNHGNSEATGFKRHHKVGAFIYKIMM